MSKKSRISYVMVTKVKDKPKRAQVNWYRDGKLGVTYVNEKGAKQRTSTGNVMCDVIREDQVDFKFGPISKDEEKKDVRKQRDAGVLRKELKKLRQEARELTNRKRKKTRKANKKRKRKSKTPQDVVKSLSKEEKEQLKKMID